MNTIEIIGDAIRYPLSDWKKVVIYGIIGFSTSTAAFQGIVASSGITNIVLIILLVTVETVLSVLFTGYFLRIIQSSLEGYTKLPAFDSIFKMFIEGVKVFVLCIIYSIPVILLTLFFVITSSSALAITAHQVLINGIRWVNSIRVLMYLGAGSGILFAMIYILTILPVAMMSVANMAQNNNELSAAFKYHEIFDRISHTRTNFIEWYLVSGMVFLIILITIGMTVIGIFSLLNNPNIGGLLISVVLAPYLYMYFARAVALFYLS